jgi:MFS family permease
MSLLFAARLIQGAADAVTWVVGFALIADLYGPGERGRVMGLVMAGTSFGLMIGPTIGGWLYEAGGIHLPFLIVAAMTLAIAFVFLWVRLPAVQVEREAIPIRLIVREPAVVACTFVVIVAASTVTMLEPVLSLWLASALGLGPARIGLVFGIAAVATAMLHPLYGRLSDRWGSRRLMMIGLGLTALWLPLLSHAWSFESAVGLYVMKAAAIALVVTPSLAFAAEAVSRAGAGSFGVAYGIYNFAWGAGLLAGPAIGGFLFERLGFRRLTMAWMPVLLVLALLLGRGAGGAGGAGGPGKAGGAGRAGGAGGAEGG